ncbi:serine/threonine-protein kinase [Ramlibacter sp. MMS24-I3-19]|uniref:serine/threonine-protein kinase n=1 Tax=Ramlibacter sp. MMS24-I3-19 TaxID=3416606 RepID=UPI003CFF0E70
MTFARAGAVDAAANPLQVAAVATIGGYALWDVLARGRRSVVYRASRRGADVALKVSPGADFAQEHWLLGQLAGDHVVQAWDHGQSRGRGWLALELAPGGSLAKARPQPLDLAMVRHRLADAARALAHVHGRGWVHRDIKPANLLLRADGRLLLADFGAACAQGTSAPRCHAVGTPLYACPELSDAAPVTPAMDIYALGAVLHEWLTGRPPFRGTTAAEQLAQHLVAPVPVLPGALSQWQPMLDAMLHKDPAQRPANGFAVLHRMPS